MRRKHNIVDILPEQFRQIQLIQLEMLLEFRRICNNNKILYSLDGGTLLGAVRHKGFIPWDPDIDVIMLRSEYDKFYFAALKDIDTDRFFLQEHRTDRYYRWGYSRIRRNNTEFIRAGHEHMKYRTGIFIDIMIVDNVPDSRAGRITNDLICLIIRKGLWSEAGKVNANSILGRLGYSILSLVPVDIWYSLRRTVYTHSNRSDTKLIRRMTGKYPKRCRYGTKRSYYDRYILLEFEGYLFSAFEQYDSYLRDVYGDYMKLPPIDQRVSHIPAAVVKLTTPILPPREVPERSN